MFNVSIASIYRQTEQNANPGAAIHAIKYYNYSMKKKQNGTFKPLVTEEAIKEESEEIEKILGIFFSFSSCHTSLCSAGILSV
jgi:hypothetical protein